MNWLRAIFAWETVFRAGIFEYQKNSVTQARRAISIDACGYSPVDMEWLCAGNPECEPKINGIPISRSGYSRYYGRPFS